MGALVMVGVSHHAAPVDVRERLAFDEAAWRAYAPTHLSSVLLSTCNRVEVYAWTDRRPSAAIRSLQRSLSRASGMTQPELQPYAVARCGDDAILHLVRVTSGLDSLVVGEEQIRGQVRAALTAAERLGPLHPCLRGIFQRVGEAARRVRGGTSLGTAPSVASAGVSVAIRHLAHPIEGKLAIVLGAGVIARAAAESLIAHGARVRVLNRTPAHAEQTMARLGPAVQVMPLEALPQALADAVVVVGATASRQPVVSHELLETALHGRGDAGPLVLVDIALPRDVDPSARELPGLILIDLDDLERMCPVDSDTREAERRRAEALAVQESTRLVEWLRQRAVSPAIAELRTYAESIRKAELRRSAPRLRDLTPEQIAAVDALTAGIVNKLMHGPTVALRDSAVGSGGGRRSHSRILRVVRPARSRSG
jgi:glutamyl-tRNA reductase